MPKYSKSSIEKLETCHLDLYRLFMDVGKYFDCTVLEGRRGEEKQELFFREGKTKLHYPNSKHNAVEPLLSDAVDVIPYPVDWRFEKELYKTVWDGHDQAAKDIGHNIQRWFMFIGYVKATARQMAIEIICGADWNGDNQMSDQRFDDLPHFELV